MNRLQIAIFIPALGAGMIAAAYAGQPAPDASAPPARPQRCFRAAEVNGWSPRGDNEVDVRVGASRHYRLSLIGACPDVDWNLSVGIRTRGGGRWICAGRGADAELIVPSPSGTQRCLVGDVRQLNEAEIAAARRDRRH